MLNTGKKESVQVGDVITAQSDLWKGTIPPEPLKTTKVTKKLTEQAVAESKQPTGEGILQVGQGRIQSEYPERTRQNPQWKFQSNGRKT